MTPSNWYSNKMTINKITKELHWAPLSDMTVSSTDIKITFSSLVTKREREREREKGRERKTKRHNAYVLTITLRDYYSDNHFNYTDSTLETSSKRTLLFRHSRFSSTEWAYGGLSDVSPFSSLLHALVPFYLPRALYLVQNDFWDVLSWNQKIRESQTKPESACRADARRTRPDGTQTREARGA